MKRILSKIGVTVLAFLVLFSSFSFTVDTHYCGDYIVDTAYFGKAKGCGMEALESSYKHQTKLTKKSCCKNVTAFVSPAKFNKEREVKLSQDEFVFLVSFVSSYFQFFQETIPKKNFFKEPPPPDIFKDIQVLYQTFLI